MLCLTGPGLLAVVTDAARDALRVSPLLPVLWGLLEAPGRETSSEHDVGGRRLRIVAGADGSLVIGTPADFGTAIGSDVAA